VSDPCYWLPVSRDETPLVVLAQASEGPWVNEAVPAEVPSVPLQFFCVRDGTYGPVLEPDGLVLIRDDLLSAIKAHCGQVFAAYAASIQPPQGGESRNDYSVLKVPLETSLSEFDRSPGRPVITTVCECRGVLAVSSELRALLEREGIHSLRFAEPQFAAA
jgi:hypothetical protein